MPLLMSATLGTASRYRLVNKQNQSIPTPEEAKSIAYPLITHVDAERKNPEEFHAASSGKQKKVKTEVKPDASSPGSIAAFAIEQAKAGARVLVIRNLVKDCIRNTKST